jgi:hypothetical protein
MEISKADLQALSQIRLEEAKLLLGNKEFSGAYYLAGYSIELALKACIAKNFRANVLPDRQFVNNIYQHDLLKLVDLAGLKEELGDAKKNKTFGAYWAVVINWNEQARYHIWDVSSATALYTAISDPINGVLQWLKKHS